MTKTKDITKTRADLIKQNTDYTLFSWCKQEGLNPIAVDRVDGVYVYDKNGKRYLDFSSLMIGTKYVITDSGGIQEETTSLKIPCFTLRDNTERPSTLIENGGTNMLISSISEIEGIMDTGEIKDTKYWDGNAFNNLEEWEYYYDSLHKPKLINNLSFDSTITVIQRDNQNVVQYEKVKEIFAVDIGLIYKSHIDLDINLSNILDINSGRELEMTVTAYGK